MFFNVSGIGVGSNSNLFAKSWVFVSARRFAAFFGIKYTAAVSDAIGTVPGIVSRAKVSFADPVATVCSGNFIAGSLLNA